MPNGYRQNLCLRQSDIGGKHKETDACGCVCLRIEKDCTENGFNHPILVEYFILNAY